MTSEQDQARLIAERVARRVGERQSSPITPHRSVTNEIGSELSAMRAGLDALRDRLLSIESRISQDTNQPSASWSDSTRDAYANAQSSPSSPFRLSSVYVPVTDHPSQQRFGVEEATITELVDFFEGEKKCELEPGGKPCDHCSMCSSRGF